MTKSKKRFSVSNGSSAGTLFRSRSLVLAGAIAGCLVFAGSSAHAQTPEGTDRIEEDWALFIKDTVPPQTAPQIVNVISPVSHIETDYAVLEMNHSTQPDYVDGGIQLQRWHGDFLCDYRAPTSHDVLSQANERITFTMMMKVESGNLVFGVDNGKSTTWGTFGGDTNQWRTQAASSVADLSGYSPQTSAKYSRVGYGANYVQSFTLTQTRYYKAGTLVKTDNTNISVYLAQ